MHSKNVKALILAAGIGSRLKPLTDVMPKCLMPIHGTPLLEYWLHDILQAGIDDIHVNVHHHADAVIDFLERPVFRNRISVLRENSLLGTAGTIRALTRELFDCTALVLHADNWTTLDISLFIDYHRRRVRDEASYLMTMVTFDCEKPHEVGIVEVDSNGRLAQFHEKVQNPPGNKANAAIYLIEPSVISWINARSTVNDFSTQVIPFFLGRTGIFHNDNVQRDIGRISSLMAAQLDPQRDTLPDTNDEWSERYKKHEIHSLIADAVNCKRDNIKA